MSWLPLPAKQTPSGHCCRSDHVRSSQRGSHSSAPTHPCTAARLFQIYLKVVVSRTKKHRFLSWIPAEPWRDDDATPTWCHIHGWMHHVFSVESKATNKAAVTPVNPTELIKTFFTIFTAVSGRILRNVRYLTCGRNCPRSQMYGSLVENVSRRVAAVLTYESLCFCKRTRHIVYHAVAP